MKLVIRILTLIGIAVVVSCTKDSIVATKPILDVQYTFPPIEIEDIDAQFAADIFYDDYELTNFDIFLPNSIEPTGLVVFIHGGGFRSGDKSLFYNDFFTENIRDLLLSEVAVATINYRLIEPMDSIGLLKPLGDAKRAIQYIRFFHEEFNIRKDDIALFGSSSGAGAALWIATHDDMKEDDHYDLIQNESTRVKGVALRGSQSTYDFERWISDVFDDFGITWDDYIEVVGEDIIFDIYGIRSWEEYYTSEIDMYRQEVDMLSMLSTDDPEVWMQNSGHPNGLPVTRTDINHHAYHAKEVKKYADASGVANVCKYGDPLIYSHPSDESYLDFLIRKVKE